MKKIILLQLLVIFSIDFSFSQTKTSIPAKKSTSTTKVDLPDLINIIDISNQTGSNSKQLATIIKKGGESNEEVIQKLNEIINNGKPTSEEAILFQQYPYIVSNKVLIESVLKNSQKFGSIPANFHYHFDMFPTLFGKNENSEIVMVINGLGYDKTFNTLQTTMS